MKFFYCWQSDLALDRNFIEDALNRAVRAIRTDPAIDVEPVVDRDTRGRPGAPDIIQTVFEKIRQSTAVVADVTIVGHDGARAFCNPNVLLETGYALGVLGDDRLILVMNTAHGDPTLLPFDLRSRRVLTYQLTAADQRAAVRPTLVAQLQHAVRVVVDAYENRPTPIRLRTMEIAINETMENIEYWLARAPQMQYFRGFPRPRLASHLLQDALREAAEASEELYQLLSQTQRALHEIEEHLNVPEGDATRVWVGLHNAINAAQAAQIALGEASRTFAVLKAAG